MITAKTVYGFSTIFFMLFICTIFMIDTAMSGDKFNVGHIGSWVLMVLCAIASTLSLFGWIAEE